ncbi:MAG TPA: TIR domain-containing protein [Pyrinomonadaceae bacterium]|nr:TIR domain-containing protein [Pyrinomonadaceae bacterium]
MQPTSTQQFSGIFVSYRRDDAAGHAGRLADRLVEHFGRNRIFVDIDSISPGEDFVTVIENAVGSCEILIAVMGQKWLSAGGTGRLDNPNDFVRLEIATALRRDIRVIPVLVQRASMPKPQDLPEDLVKLTRRNAIELSDQRWQTDVDQLIEVMEKVLAKRAGAGRQREIDESNFATGTIITGEDASRAYKRKRLMLIAGASLIVLLAATLLIWRFQRVPNSTGSNTQAAPVQSPLVTQATPVKPTPTPELKPSPAPEADAFAEPTLWKRDDSGTIVQIVRSGNTLKARVVKASDTAAAAGRNEGDVAFEGSYEDRKIKGTAYLRFSPDDVSKCPAFGGEQPWDLELTLSADGNKLKGSRADYELSDDCNIQTNPRRRIAYTKILR